MPFAVNTMCLGGRYTLIAKIGAGGQAEVWRARDHTRGDEIALKILNADLAKSPGAWEALQREYVIVSRLRHPLILKVFAPERDEDIVALPMELAPGGDLRRLRGVSYLEIGPVLLEVAQALAHAHGLGVVHRDLKPENVLFDSQGHVRVADFGAADSLTGSTSGASEPNRVKASPFSASPEQLRGEPPAVSDDIYGLGALAYELLSGRPPYHPRFELKRVMEEPVPPVQAAHQTPERLTVLVMSMLAKPARRRPASMRDVIEALDATLNDTLTFETAAAASPVPVEAPIAVPTATTWLPPAADLQSRAIPAASLAEPESSAEQMSIDPAEIVREVSEPVMVRANEELSQAPANQTPPAYVMAAARLPEPWRRAVESATRRAPESHTTFASESDEGRARAAVARQSAPYATLRADRPAPARASAAAAESARASPSAAHADLFAPASSTASSSTRPGPAPEQDLRRLWADIKVERMPNLMRLEPVRRSRWPWVFFVGLAAAVALIYFSLPRDARQGVRAMRLPSSADLRIAMQNIADTSRRVASAVESPSSSAAAGNAGNATRHEGTQTPAGGTAQDATRATRGVATVAGAGAALAATANGVTTGTQSSAAATTASGAAPYPKRAHARVVHHEGHSARDSYASGPFEAEGLPATRSHVESRRAALDARGAAFWGGAQYEDALARESDAVKADQAGDASGARRERVEAEQLLDGVEQKAPLALNAELYAGERALQEGNRPAARRAFELADRIDPGNPSAERGLQRASVLDGVLPLLADGLNAEAARNYSRAAQDYGQALALDPSNTRARAGLKRADAAWGGNTYAEAVSTGFGLLGAGRLDPAREAFTKALAINARGQDAQEGLERVAAALRSRGLSQLRSRAATLESEERWGEALQDYNAALRLDPSLSFAQQGRTRAMSHLALAGQPGYDRTVHLALISDNETEVEIEEIGSFGTFAKREIDLKPGRYTVIGTRAGYRAVRRDVTVTPGQDAQTISVRCEEPI
jgi:serine/threonine protein kinase